MSTTELSEKWYYDACTLDHKLTTYGEIINDEHISITSNLAIGEGCANCLLKWNNIKGYDVLDSFIDLLKKLRDQDLLKIVGNNDIESILARNKESVPRLSVTDSIHLATALREKCCIFRTIDNDFDELTKNIEKRIANENGMPKFAVSKMSSVDTALLFKKEKSKNRKKK